MPKLTEHAKTVITSKGFDADIVLDVISNYETAYQSKRYPWQRKYVGRGLCVVVDERRNNVVTVFKHYVRTPDRPDQETP